ncbi:MAG: hypothetical protein RRY04_08105 [Oscillospiraceae bacterium]
MKLKAILLSLILIAFSALASCSPPVKEPQLQEIPFFSSLEFEDGQYAVILDIADETILYYVCHDEGSAIYPRSDYIGTWDIDSGEIISMQEIDARSIPCAGVLWQDGAYFSLMTDTSSQAGRWKLLCMKGDSLSTLDSGCSRSSSMEHMPCLTKTVHGVVYSYEDTSVQAAGYGIRRIEKSGKAEELWSRGFGEAPNGSGPISLFLKGSGEALAFFEEENGVGQFVLVDGDGDAETIPLYGKLYDFCVLENAFIQSCDDGENNKTVAVSDLKGEQKLLQPVPVRLFRMYGCGGSEFIAVDEQFNIVMGKVTDGSVELKELEVPLELTHRAVMPVYSGESTVFLSYMQTARNAQDAVLYRLDLV